MDNGWVKLHRKLLTSIIFGNDHGLKIWIWCLLKANHKEKSILIGRQKLVIKEGEFIMGSSTAKEMLKMAKATIWYWLNFLEQEGQVVLKKTNKYTIVKVKNWKEYQDLGRKQDTDETQKERQVGTNNNVKNEKNEKNIISSELSSRDIEKLFKVFYKINPTINWGNKTSRKAAAEIIKIFGIEDALVMAEQIVAVQGKKYAPTCTTPYQMKEKLAEFKIYFEKEKNIKPLFAKI